MNTQEEYKLWQKTPHKEIVFLWMVGALPFNLVPTELKEKESQPIDSCDYLEEFIKHCEELNV